MRELTIGELARQAQLPASTLRYYESIGLLTPLKRVGGQRRYSPEARQRLSFIKLAQQAGFTGLEIKSLLEGFNEGDGTPPLSQWQALACHKLAEVAAMLERAQQMKKLLEEGLRCGCFSYDECQTLFDRQGHC